jgi:hypothetical protein
MKSITFALAGVLLAAVAGTAVAAELPDLKGRTIQAVTENAYTPLNFADPRPDRASAGSTTPSTKSASGSTPRSRGTRWRGIR